MTKQITNLFLACSATCLMGIALHAESYQSKATIPFAFQVDGKNVDAGAYIVRESSNQVESLRNAKTGKSIFLCAHGGTAEGNGPARLVFHRYGDRYFLAEVWSPGHEGTVLKTTKAEKELMTAGARQEAAIVLFNSRPTAD